MPKFYEFFSGGGMARLGLGINWNCLFANDICKKKVETYSNNFGIDEVVCRDIYKLETKDLPDYADLIWGSFPCQDLSLAGNGAGLNGERSGTFNKLVSLVADLKKEQRTPKIIVLENVVGAITSHNGKDFQTIISSLVKLGYLVGCMVIDAAAFVPQSRPRLFIVAVNTPKSKLVTLSRKEPDPYWHPENLQKAQNALPKDLKQKWVWWSMPHPTARKLNLNDIVEMSPDDVKELDDLEIGKLISMMSETNLIKVERAKKSGNLIVGGLYKRMRKQKDGTNLQRAEVRFDGTAGCLRTPSGGSSRQTIILIKDNKIRARLLSRREAARLMGVPESYKLPQKYNDAYHVFGDGLVVPAVSWLERFILTPLSKVE